MIWFWNWHETKYIEKRKQGIVFYTKSKKNDCIIPFLKERLNRRLETKRIITHRKK